MRPRRARRDPDPVAGTTPSSRLPDADDLRYHVRDEQITPALLLVGYRGGMLTLGDVVDAALRRYRAAIELSSVEEAIALTLRGDLDEVPAMLEGAAAAESLAEARRVWTYVSLRALRLRWSSSPDPMYELEDAIERFGEPDPYYAFLPYLPPSQLERQYGRVRYLDALDAQLRLDAHVYGWADALEPGNALADAGEHVAAIAAFARAEACGVDGASLNIGNSFRAVGDLDSAAAAFRRGWERGDDDAALNLALVLDELGDAEAALSVLRRLVRKGYVKARINLAWMLWDAHDEAGAEQVLKPALDTSDDAVRSRARGMFGTWRWDRSKDPTIRPLLEDSHDSYPPARVALAELLAGEGEQDRALELLGRGADADEVESMVPLGNYYWEAGQQDLAVAILRRAAELGDAFAAHNLGLLYAELDDFVEAAKWIALGAERGDPLSEAWLRQHGV